MTDGDADCRVGMDLTVLPAGQENDWLSLVWRALDRRSRTILERRLAGETLDSIGQDFGVVRERVRQLQASGIDQLLRVQEAYDPRLRDRIVEALEEPAAISESTLIEITGLEKSCARDILMGRFGLTHPKVGSRVLDDLWAADSDELSQRIRRLYNILPCARVEFMSATVEVGIPPGVDFEDEHFSEAAGFQWTEIGIVRRKRYVRDLAFLWLQAEGAPRSLADIATASGAKSQPALREKLRRDDGFAQVRPEGTWALADWRLPEASRQYESAIDAVIEVLRDLGPLSLSHLQTEVQLRYPVSLWRIQQCLSSNIIGLNADGEFDLAERGAHPIEDAEPGQPSNIQESGPVVGVSLRIDHNLLRGSGLAVHKWLTWRLGLRTAPSSRLFRMADGGELVVRRGLSNPQVSSLRVPALRLGVVEGCRVVLLLRMADDTADLIHSCSETECPVGHSGR